MVSISTTHKEEHITFQEFNETWKCEALSLENKSLGGLKSAIDRAKQQSRKVNLEVGVFDTYGRGRSSTKHVRLTSVTDDGDVWFTDKKGDRGKTRIDKIFFAQGDNATYLSEAKRIAVEMSVAREKAQALLDKITTTTVDEIRDRDALAKAEGKAGTAKKK